MRHCLVIVMAACLVAFASCTGNKVYDHYEHTPIAGWDKVDTLTFDVPALQDSWRYATNLGLRINDAFPFQSLTLIVEQSVYPTSFQNSKSKSQASPSGRINPFAKTPKKVRKVGAPTVYIDTLNCTLFDRKGAVKGQGISYYQYHFRVSELDLHEGDSIHITVRHDMKREIMPGIADVGISIGKVQ